MFLITHDQAEALEIADRIAVMNQGVIQQIGTPDEILNHPVNRFVADFVGEPAMNFLDGTLEQQDDALYFNASGYRLRLPNAAKAVLSRLNGDSVLLGIRPIHVHSGGGAAVNEGVVEAPLFLYEMLGERSVATVEFGDQKVQAVVDARYRPKAGELVPLRFEADRLHFFSKSTQLALS